MSGKAIRETLTALGVIASMVFVGMEIRQNTTVARAQVRQFLTENHREINIGLATDPTLLSVIADRLYPSDVRSADERRMEWAMFAVLRHLENVLLQVQEGVIDESVYHSYGWVDVPMYGTPEFREWWVARRTRFHPDFVAAFEAEYDLTP